MTTDNYINYQCYENIVELKVHKPWIFISLLRYTISYYYAFCHLVTIYSILIYFRIVYKGLYNVSILCHNRARLVHHVSNPEYYLGIVQAQHTTPLHKYT